ncbi:MAG: hypothetical protein RL375_4909 [Pseudomonadota bacterium]
MKFIVQALAPGGELVPLQIDAADPNAARLSATAQGFRVVAVRGGAGWSPLAALAGLRLAPASTFSLQLFCQELVSLLDAGLSLVEAIDLLSEKERGRAGGQVLTQLRGDLQRGLSFSDALAHQPTVFAALFVATVRASERTGDIAQAIGRFLAYRQQVDAIRRRVVSASVYPLVLMVVGLLVASFMLLFVVPRFSRIYEELGNELPWLTRAMIDWAHVLDQQAWLLVPFGLAALAGAAYLLTRPSVRAALVRSLWRVPMIGRHLAIYELARLYRTLGMLLDSGVTLPSALDMSGGLLSPTLRAGLAAAAADIRAGQPVSRAFERHGLTTTVSQRLLGVGERSGRLPHMVQRIALFHEDELGRWLEWFTRLFEPALMMVIGALVGLIVVLLYLPIFQLADSIR